MQLNKLLLILLSLFFLNSCIELFTPNNLDYKGSIFVEGLVTDDPNIPPRVKISRSIPIEKINGGLISTDQSFIDDAEVFLLCDDGSDYQLNSIGSGVYEITDIGFIGEPGKSYKLIIYSEGEEFESGFEVLNSSPIIDSLSYNVTEEKLSDDGTISSGYKFLVSTHDESEDDFYFRWTVDITYSYSVPHLSDYVWKGYLLPYDNSELIYCWRSRSIPNIFIVGTKGLERNAIIEEPLHFESQHGPALSEKYFVHVSQLSISEENYNFWKELDKLINQTGGLYQTQPFRLSGNIECTTNDEVQVIGIFEAAGISEDEKYYNKPTEFPIIRNPCTLEQVGTVSYPWLMVDRTAMIIYSNSKYYTADINCFDCTTMGGTTEKPAFWEY